MSCENITYKFVKPKFKNSWFIYKSITPTVLKNNGVKLPTTVYRLRSLDSKCGADISVVLKEYIPGRSLTTGIFIFKDLETRASIPKLEQHFNYLWKVRYTLVRLVRHPQDLGIYL